MRSLLPEFLFFMWLVASCRSVEHRSELAASPSNEIEQVRGAEIQPKRECVSGALYARLDATFKDQQKSQSDRARAVISFLRECDGVGAPSSFKSRVEILKNPPLPMGITTEQLIRNLQDRDAIRAVSQELTLDKFISNWSSGGRLGNRRLDPALTSWFQQSFRSIATRFPDIRLNLLDLFHGHLVLDQAARDVLIVLHSKEYPDDLEPFKVQRALTVNPSLPRFTTGGATFAKRNLVWSLRAGKIWRINTSPGSQLAELVRPEATGFDSELALKANTLREDLLGTIICDINYYESYNNAPVAPFLY